MHGIRLYEYYKSHIFVRALISIVLGLLGLIGSFVSIPFVSGFAFWFVFVGLALLVAGLLVNGL